MDNKDHEKQDRVDLRWGCFHLSLFLLLIVSGIVVKRVFGHPEFMMAFHGPAAVFLIVGGLRISSKQRRKFNDVKVNFD